jgi:hypothetical protein
MKGFGVTLSAQPSARNLKVRGAKATNKKAKAGALA